MARIQMIRFGFYLLSIPVHFCCAGTEPDTTHTFLLGEEKVWVHIYERAGADVTLINLHDDENTALHAGLAFIDTYGGRLIELRHGRGRDVVVRLNGKLNRFDPNRMFSDPGLRASLNYFSNNTDEVFSAAAVFRDSLLSLLAAEKANIIMAVHNNTPGKMTIEDFRPGEWYGHDTDDVFIHPNQDPDDFFFVADPTLFDALAKKSYNVALRAENPPDRGMLIDYCTGLGILHITVEAEHGKLQKQKEMLETLWEIYQEGLKRGTNE